MPDFPADTERLLLGVAVNQAAGLLQRKEVEEELRKQSEWLRVTLSSIGDAVITTDTEGRVTSLNAVAESLTGWSRQEADGVPLEQVFHIVNEQSRQPAENPATRSLREGQIVGLANHTVLIARDGTERAIERSLEMIPLIFLPNRAARPAAPRVGAMTKQTTKAVAAPHSQRFWPACFHPVSSTFLESACCTAFWASAWASARAALISCSRLLIGAERELARKRWLLENIIFI